MSKPRLADTLYPSTSSRNFNFTDIDAMPIHEPIILALVVTLVMMVTLCAITDILEHRIPNVVLLPGLILALVFNTWLGGTSGFIDSVLGMVIGLALLLPFYFSGGISAGDVKLLGVVGAFFGSGGALTAGIAAVVFAGILGVVIITWRLIEPTLSMHIGQIAGTNEPGTHSTVKPVTLKETRSLPFPYAPAIACGSYFALWHMGYFSPVVG